DLFLVIYSVDSYESFRGMTDLLDEIMATKYEALSRDAPLQSPPDVPIVVIGNKADREAQRVVGRQEAESAVARRGGVPLFETSAKSNANVVAAFARLFERARLPVEMCPSMHSVLPTFKMPLLQRSSWLDLLGRRSRAEAYGVVIPNVCRPCLSSELEKIQGGKFKAGKLGNRCGTRRASDPTRVVGEK
ncbi:PREDICTED: GTP-binding protein Rhes-like, partial [Priapulus caudatus]|uniref:GTP-binding protein Rhes-like n=1 Tax=Priapulus caudatus TaxID=37621 RepID=A0ABM1F6V1_PRICU